MTPGEAALVARQARRESVAPTGSVQVGPFAPVLVEGPGTLPRPPGVLRQFWAQHPRIADASVTALVIGIEVVGLIAQAHVDNRRNEHVGLIVGGLTICAVGLMLRRVRPWLGFALTALVVVPLGTSPTAFGPLTLAVTLFALAAVVSPKVSWLCCAGVVLAIEGALLMKYMLLLTTPTAAASPLTRLASTHTEMIPLTLTLLVATLMGISSGNRKRYIAALVEHASQLARERDQQAQLAAAAERSRIAREIHDIVAHSLSVMVRLADGAETVITSDPKSAQAVLEQIGKTGRSSLAEMRRVLGVLQDDVAADLDPSPDVTDLPVLIGTYRRAGLPITYRINGEPPTSAGVQLAVFRAVQEMLTNALRHAVSPHAVDVDIDFRGGVTLTVTNDSTAPPAPAGTTTPGRGLIGMRERAALYGGTVTSGPAPGSGWSVQMTLPEAGRDS